MRQYGGERLREAGEEAAVRRAPPGLVRRLGRAGGAGGCAGAEQAAWLDRLEREHDNLRAALAWSQSTPGAAEAGLRLAGALWSFWYMRGYFTEGRRWLTGRWRCPARAAGPARPAALDGAGALAQARRRVRGGRSALRGEPGAARELGDRW